MLTFQLLPLALVVCYMSKDALVAVDTLPRARAALGGLARDRATNASRVSVSPFLSLSIRRGGAYSLPLVGRVVMIP
jgi:hypothetical protein